MTLVSGGAANAVTPLGVSATGLFELDGTDPLHTDSKGNIDPTTSGTSSDPNAVNNSAIPGQDWADVYNKTMPAGVKYLFVKDEVNSTPQELLFTGGGSKDGSDISSWRWTSGAGVQDKNDIEDAYAARYPDGAAGAGQPAYMFFGLDRYATAGDAAVGFWFLKAQMKPVTATGSNGQPANVFGPGAVHHTDDVLVQIDYTSGGAQPTVRVSKWCEAVDNANACASVGLNVIQPDDNHALCGFSSGAPYCAATNLHEEKAPWGFIVKNPNPGDSGKDLSARTFFEGGLNLASFHLDKDCYSTFLAETRSSQVFSSTLSDFASDSFPGCTADLTTTPSANTTDKQVSPGTSVTDKATITGTGITTPPFPSSSTTAPGTGNKVVFSLCGPSLVTDTTTCAAGSTPAPVVSGASKDLTATATAGVSEATSDAVNTAAKPLAPGRYCWLATWAGDSNYTKPLTDSNPSDECFTVRQIPTTTVTTPSDSSGAALGSATQTVGTKIYDSAVVTATASGGGALSGDVAFFVCSPSQTVGGVCPDKAGTAAGDPTVTGTGDPSTATVLSNAVTTNATGTWCFRAVFTSTNSGYQGSDDTGHASECVKVGPVDTNTTTTPTLIATPSNKTIDITSKVAVGSQVFDHAVVASKDAAALAAVGSPTGTVTFYYCKPSELDANSLCSTGGTKLTPDGTLVAQADKTSATDSPTITADAVGRWCFRGVYSGDSNYNSSTDYAVNECFTVKDTTSASSRQNWLPNDHAVITSTDKNTTVSGVINLTLYPTSDCTGTAVAGQSYTSPAKGVAGHLTGTQTISFDSSNTTFKVDSPSTTNWSWLVTFTSDDENTVGSSSHCETTSMTITN